MSPRQSQDRECADKLAAGIDSLVRAWQAESGKEALRGWKHRGDGVALSITNENAMQGKEGASHWTSVMLSLALTSLTHSSLSLASQTHSYACLHLPA